jgi:hypothetical protein
MRYGGSSSATTAPRFRAGGAGGSDRRRTWSDAQAAGRRSGACTGLGCEDHLWHPSQPQTSGPAILIPDLTAGEKAKIVAAILPGEE